MMEANTVVYLVGAGPGDAGLITAAGLELLGRADVVVYDYLSNTALLDRVPASAERLYVGKKGFAAHTTQNDINALLVDKARQLEQRGGGTLVRLKGGDPFVFGRGGEEALALADAGIPFRVVPGVTAGIAAPAYAGIPVTHRGISSSVTFVTGHEDPAKDATSIDWMALARLAARGSTLCFYMGVRNLGMICARLQEEGAPGETPVALVRWGTLPSQEKLTATLADAPEAARAAHFTAPAIILVGGVARLSSELAWFERLPLFGRRIVVTRSRTQTSAFSRRLTELGAAVCEFPTIALADPDSYDALDAALADLASFRWVVFTSANGVERFFARLEQSARPGALTDARALAHARIAAIGPATAYRLRTFGIKADAVPDSYRGEAVFEAIRAAEQRAQGSVAGARVLIPRAQEARPQLPHLLREAGADVTVAPAYKTVLPNDADAADLVRQLQEGAVDAVTFTSSSTARNLFALLGDDAPVLRRSAQLFSIGPITTGTLVDAGCTDVHEAEEYTIDGLVECLCGYYRERKDER